MRFLLDTNIFIPLEIVRKRDIEAGSNTAASFLRLCRKHRQDLLVHPIIRTELQKDRDEERRQVRLQRMEGYLLLEDPPALSETIIERVPNVSRESHDYIDLLLLAAVERNAVDYLVTDDRGLHRKAKVCNLSERTLSLSDALALLHFQFPDPSITLFPGVSHRKVHSLNPADSIFQTLRADYEGFDAWLSKCSREQRDCFFIGDPNGKLAALCIYKVEVDSLPVECSGKTLKISTFKVDMDFSGYRYGELLLKTILRLARDHGYRSVFLTAKENKEYLLQFLDEYGFFPSAQRDQNGDLILIKRIFPPEGARDLAPLDFAIQYGPGIESKRTSSLFLIPIKPRYHDLLFPDAIPHGQGELFPAEFSFQNTIRKAYLCRSGIRQVQPGDILLFYRSGDLRQIVKLGVAEKTLVSSLRKEIELFVSKRTVYSSGEIEQMLVDKELLSILFRESRSLKNPISYQELELEGIVQGAIQSIQQIKEEKVSWIIERITE